MKISNIVTQANPRTLTILAPKTNLPIDIVFEYITPAMAKNWLKDNVKGNRKVSSRHVTSYATAMLNGQWDHSNGDSIAFNQDGKLVNGQHRLMSVVEANISVWMMVMYGVSKDAILTLDDGNARTLGDALTINGVKILGRISSHASAIKVLSNLKTCFAKDVNYQTIKSSRHTNSELVAFYETLTDYNDLSNDMHERWSLGELEQVMPASVLITMYYLFNGVHPEACTELLQTFYDKIPAGKLGKLSPAWIVMRKIQRSKEDGIRLRTDDYINWFVWALMKTVDQEATKLVPPLGWQFKKEFKGRLQVKQKLQSV